MGKKLDIPPGTTFENKYWQVIKEIDKKGQYRYFLCKCLLCNREYEMRLGTLRTKNTCFCCQSCAISKYFENKADDLIGQKFSRLTVVSKDSQDVYGKWQYLCKCECGNEKVILGNSLCNGNTQSCGCLAKDVARELGLSQFGENSTNWQGGKSAQNELDRAHLSNVINPIIRERDDYTCQKCGQYKGWLNVHHIYDFSTYPLLRFEEYNLITLCKTCHDDFHKIYPNKFTNTLQNLEDWMGHEYKYHQSLTNYYEYYYN